MALGYPYTYKDYLSEEEAMQRRVHFFDRVADKYLVLAIFWSVLIPTNAFAIDLPANPGPSEATKVTTSPNPVVFAPITGICKCASPRVKTGILLVGITSVCYSALCSKDKRLIVACGSLATYVATQLVE